MPPIAAGILALQGDVRAHEAALGRRGVRTRRVVTAADLAGLAGLILPGGESSVMWKLAAEADLLGPLREAVLRVPVLATCAGVILLASEVRRPRQPSLGLLDVVVERNGYGRQLHSGVHALAGRGGFPSCDGVFIRAPRIVDTGPGVEVLATRGDDPALVRSGHVLGAVFHPELSEAHPALDLYVAQLAARPDAPTTRAG